MRLFFVFVICCVILTLNIMTKIECTFQEVPQPHNLYCKSGHIAAKEFRRNGKDSELELTKFFSVSITNNPSLCGIYCEPCLILANAVKDQIKKSQ